MHPFLSWSILLIVIFLGYVTVKGLPDALRLPGRQISTQSQRAKTKRKRARKDKVQLPSGQILRDDIAEQSSSNKHAKTDASSSIRRPDNAHILESDKSQFDAVEHVMNGRPRKTSTPIGYSVHKSKTQDDDAAIATTNSSNDDEQSLATTLSEDQWQHVSPYTSDDSDVRRPRTLKIVPSTSAAKVVGHNKTQRSTQASETMTKKQRQNAAKKAKRQEEKALAEEQQAAALKAHRKTLETQRMQNTRSAAPATSVSKAWGDNDWETVTKVKKVAGTSSRKTTSSDELIW